MRGTWLAGDNTRRCICHKCIEENGIRDSVTGFPLSSMRIILCPDCGNKRCPKASDHTLACTGSNDPGQVGSVYPGFEVKEPK